MEKNKPIVILDSGIGGLFVYQQLKKHLPFENFCAIADNAFFPYGTRTIEQLTFRWQQLFEMASQFQPKLVIVACNSLSLAIPANSSMIHMLNGVAALEQQVPEAMILSTNLAASIRKNKGISLDGLAEQIEQNAPLEALRTLQNATSDTFILGCTHYSWVIDELKNRFPAYTFLDPTAIVVQEVVDFLKDAHLLCSSNQIIKDHFYSTGDNITFFGRAKKYLDIDQVKRIEQATYAL